VGVGLALLVPVEATESLREIFQVLHVDLRFDMVDVIGRLGCTLRTFMPAPTTLGTCQMRVGLLPFENAVFVLSGERQEEVLRLAVGLVLQIVGLSAEHHIRVKPWLISVTIVTIVLLPLISRRNHLSLVEFKDDIWRSGGLPVDKHDWFAHLGLTMAERFVVVRRNIAAFGFHVDRGLMHRLRYHCFFYK